MNLKTHKINKMSSNNTANFLNLDNITKFYMLLQLIQ